MHSDVSNKILVSVEDGMRVVILNTSTFNFSSDNYVPTSEPVFIFGFKFVLISFNSAINFPCVFMVVPRLLYIFQELLWIMKRAENSKK